MTDWPDLRPYTEEIARRLLGQPNESLSNRGQLRFGTYGSVAIEIAGPKQGEWFDHENQIGGGPWQLLTLRGGMANGAAIEWLRSEIGIDIQPGNKASPRIVATYDYRNEQGELLFQVVRFDPKDFRQRRSDGNGGWIWSVRGIRQIPYRLPELVAAPPGTEVFITEGEKDADRTASLGLLATCNAGGAAKRKADGKPGKPKWRPELNPFFGGLCPIIICDNDDAGRDHAHAVAANLAARVRILELPGLPPKGDVSDWLAAGGTREELERLAAAAPDFQPEPNSNIPEIETKPRPESALVIDTGAPYTTAKLFLNRFFTEDEKRTLHHHRGAFYRWDGSAYPDIVEEELRSRLYAFLDQCFTRDPKGESRPVKPGAAMVTNVLDGLRAASHLEGSIAAPAWLEQVPDIPAEEIVACANGLLHLSALTLLPHTPAFFTYNALEFAFERAAPEPRKWLAVLHQLWPEDPEAIGTLQEIFGYSLTSDARQQKAFLIVGPKRSGKGTIARVLARLVGAGNAVAPTLAGLGMNFGLAPLIGKRVAVISDARLGGRADQHAIAERLLSITGEDAITIDRKYLSAWTGQLQARFIIISNELPRLADASGALASRFIVLILSNSFYGKEDLALTSRLLTELPGILNWAITGWHRLTERGHFVQPRSALDAVQQLEDLGSPVGVFLRERCVVGAGYTVEINRLFEAWCEWCRAQGREHPGTAQSLGRDLRAVLPGLKTTQPRDGEERLRFYQGIGLR
jgi:putative DNA primase/helicase